MKPDIVARRIGRDGEPVVVIDHFAPDPDALRAAALASRFEPARRHYPGLRAELPPDYFAPVRPIIAIVLAEVFGLTRSADLLDASFSIVTTPPDQLTLQQRLPHVDATAPGRIALVHYLTPEGGDGTAFFRHRSTGFERLDDERGPVFARRLKADLAGQPEPAGYIADSTPLFERTALIEGRYNRAVIYRSALFHSGAIGPGAVISDDPARARLTVTAFLSAS